MDNKSSGWERRARARLVASRARDVQIRKGQSGMYSGETQTHYTLYFTSQSANYTLLELLIILPCLHENGSECRGPFCPAHHHLPSA